MTKVNLPDYIMEVKVTGMDLEFLEPKLKNWNNLNDYLRDEDPESETLIKLLKMELYEEDKKPRALFIDRLHSRLHLKNRYKDIERIGAWLRQEDKIVEDKFLDGIPACLQKQ